MKCFTELNDLVAVLVLLLQLLGEQLLEVHGIQSVRASFFFGVEMTEDLIAFNVSGHLSGCRASVLNACSDVNGPSLERVQLNVGEDSSIELYVSSKNQKPCRLTTKRLRFSARIINSSAYMRLHDCEVLLADAYKRTQIFRPASLCCDPNFFLVRLAGKTCSARLKSDCTANVTCMTKCGFVLLSDC